MLSAAKIEKIYKILSKYKGYNNQILYYKSLYNNGKLILNDFSAKYIEDNRHYKPIDVNRVVKISSDYGAYLKEKLNLEFVPNRVRILRIIGEYGNSLHCYMQYRNSVPPKLWYISRNYILDGLSNIKMLQISDVDFTKYDKMTESDGRMLKEHQKEAVCFLLSNKKCILADQMGCGKTTSAIIAALEGGFDRILVITTASMKSTWQREISLYEDPSNISIVNGTKWEDGHKFTIINYDILQNFYQVPYEEHEIVDPDTGNVTVKKQKSRNKRLIKRCLEESSLFKEKFQCIIIDEAQRLSNKTSIRYKTTYDFIHRLKPEYIFMLTGTPLTNRPINLFNILCLIDADVTRDYNYYCKRYCEGKEIHLKTGKTVMLNKGASHLDELREKIKHLYIRRLQSDVNKLVDKTKVVREYSLNDSQMAEYSRLWEDYLKIQAANGRKDADVYKDLVESIIVRQYLALQMVPHTIELADSQLEYGEKVIIVTNFKEELDKFMEHYGSKAVAYRGNMTNKQKDNAVSSFMNSDKVNVFVCNLTAASLGITLTASHFIIFNSYSWIAADNEQMEFRIYRLTQTKDITCVYQTFDDPISKDMFEKVCLKKEIMDQTIKSEKEK